ncbi:MAG: DUF6538 domain-containing protein, partial [Paracoccaceae bacterium]
MNVSNCVDGVERRGYVYYLRWRVPAEFRAVEARSEINQSLKTRDLVEALTCHGIFPPPSIRVRPKM